MSKKEIRCPVCDFARSRPSIFGSTYYRDQQYVYRDCQACASIFVEPMPDAQAVGHMYGSDYSQFLSTEDSHGGKESIDNVLEFLGEREKGSFLDYGCGAGSLLKEVSKLGWDVVGLEFDTETAENYGQAQSLRIVSDVSKLGDGFRADVIHLGDVLEHLPNLNELFPKILKLLRPEGYLIAQGPLEANRNLFFQTLKFRRKVLPSTPQKMPPYHVLLATTVGQREFFRRFGLDELEFRTFETAHPAPARIDLGDLMKPRSLGLFLLRKLSQATTHMSRSNVGNRYLFIGRNPG